MCDDTLLLVINWIVFMLIMLVFCLYEFFSNSREDAIFYFISSTIFSLFFFFLLGCCSRCSRPEPRGRVVSEVVNSQGETKYLYEDRNCYCKYVIEEGDDDADSRFQIYLDSPDDKPDCGDKCIKCGKCHCDHSGGQITRKDFDEMRRKLDEYEYNPPY